MKTLCELISVANYMNIPEMVDVTCQAVVDQMKSSSEDTTSLDGIRNVLGIVVRNLCCTLCSSVHRATLMLMRAFPCRTTLHRRKRRRTCERSSLCLAAKLKFASVGVVHMLHGSV